MSETTAELTFCVGGSLGYCHRNDTNAADGSRVATAVKFSYELQVLDLLAAAAVDCHENLLP